MNRQLAAILFFRITGEHDHAPELFKNSRIILEPLIEDHHGNWLKETSDGAMVQFSSALDAVNCGVEMQQAASEQLDCRLSIGIHLGDIITGQQEVSGDGVNLASSIGATAEPGSIYISQAVQGAIKGSDVHTAFRGEKKLKNVDRPIRLFQVVNEAESISSASTPFKSYLPWLAGLVLIIAFAIWRLSSSPAAVEGKTIAVLPLTMNDADGNSEYLVQGITEELVRSLGQLKVLTVVNSFSTMRFMASIAPVQDATSSMPETDYFLSGSCERDADLLKLQLALYDHDQQQLWGNEYSGAVHDLPNIAGAITVDLAEFIKLNLTANEASRMVEIPSMDPELFELLLLGRNHLSKFTPQDIAIGLNYLQQAVDRNPTSSRAWSMLAEGLVTMGHSPAPPPGVRQQATAAASRALQLDSLNAEAWAWLATTKTYYDWDYRGAENSYERANALNPNLPMSHYHYSWHLYLFDSLERAVEEHERAFQLDPLDPFQAARLAHIYLIAGELDRARVEVDRARRLNKDFLLTHEIEGMLYMKHQQYDSAEIAFKKQGAQGVAGLGMLYLKSGRYAEGLKIIESLKENINSFHAVVLSSMYAEIDSLDQFFKYANYEPTHAFHPWLRVEVKNPKVINDPRFEQLMNKMNLPMPNPDLEPATTF